MKTLFLILMLIAMVGVVASLLAGVILMGKGGDQNKKHANKLMQTRVYCLGAALLFLALLILASSN